MWWMWAFSAVAGSTHEVIVPAWVASDPAAYATALEDAAAGIGWGQDGVRLMVRSADGGLTPAERFLPEAPDVPVKEEGRMDGPPVDLPGATAGSLSGRAIYASQCHGWIWSETLGRFATQRGNWHDTVEDFHNPEGMNQFLFRYLENGGARVFSARERDHNAQMAIADNDGEGYREEGEGFTDGAPGFLDGGPWAYGENPFEAGTTRRFAGDSGSVATWVPEVPSDGHYAIYVAWDADPDHAAAAHYRLIHPGGTIDRYFDQRVHGSTWQYVETLWLPGGVESLTVQLIGDGTSSAWVSADSVRIGGGNGDVERFGETTGRPRHEEGAILYNQFNGAPTSIYDPYGDGDGSDPSTRSRWAAWEHPSGEDALYISWHSNASGAHTARGTVTYAYEGDYGLVDGSVVLAETLQDELINAIGALWADSWNDRGIGRASFSELSPYHNDEIPAALVELAFHDEANDAAYLKEPGFRRDMSRAMYRAIVRYFAERDGDTPRFLPEPPVGLTVTHGSSGELEASWTSGPSGDPFGDPADGYLLYRSADGRSWDNGTPVEGTQVKISAEHGETVYVRVAAVNDAGVSFPTETLGARRSSDGWAPVLVVAAFDRLRASNLVWEDVPTLGSVVRMPLERVNPFDITVASGASIENMGWYFDAVSDEAFPELDLEDYQVVIWAAGQESTEDETLNSEQQRAVRNFLTAGGAVWVTGSEVLWDLDYRGDEDDQAFARDVLKASMGADDSGTEMATGKALLEGLILNFGESDGAPYPVGYPDVLDTDGQVIATYSDGTTAGVLHSHVALFGFPFECIGDPEVRDEVVARLLPVLAPDYEPPDPEEGEDADTGLLAEGSDDSGDARLPPREEDASKGCTCSTGRLGGLSLLPLGLLGLIYRRR